MAVTVDNLAEAVIKELRSYNQEITEEIKAAVEEVAKECKDEIKAASPVRTGEYKKGWRIKKEFENHTDIRFSVFNGKKPQLTHLLENGYLKRGGGRTQPHPHIAKAEENAVKKLEERAEVIVKG